MQEERIVIVIPCFNEATGFKTRSFIEFIAKFPNIHLCFVDDGSTDETLQRLSDLQSEAPDRISVVESEHNQGKANALLLGFSYMANSQIDYQYIAYLDCDLSAPLSEIPRLTSFMRKGNVEFCYGSRIQKVDNNIHRKFHRWIIGRVIATIIAKTFRLRTYDTQCGCKVFEKDLALELFKTPFVSKWLFDVELFLRAAKIFGRNEMPRRLREEPVREWIDYGNSKLKISYGFLLIFDIIKIYRRYSVNNR